MKEIDVNFELDQTEWLDQEKPRVMLEGPSVVFYRFVLEQFKSRGRSVMTKLELANAIGVLVMNDIAEVLETYGG